MTSASRSQRREQLFSKQYRRRRKAGRQSDPSAERLREHARHLSAGHAVWGFSLCVFMFLFLWAHSDAAIRHQVFPRISGCPDSLPEQPEQPGRLMQIRGQSSDYHLLRSRSRDVPQSNRVSALLSFVVEAPALF